jgi:creatinine amidohydrolase
VSYLLPTTTSGDEKERAARVAVLPVGSFEQHGDHLLLATDTMIAVVLAERIAEAYGLFLLPPITISCSHEHAGWAGTVSISATTLHAMIGDIMESLRAGGVERLLIISGHGGNYVLSNVVQEASVRGPEMALFPRSSDWDGARVAAGLSSDGHEDMHAGELETSILLYAVPDVVRAGYARADHVADERPHMLSLGLRAYTSTGVVGRPSLGTAQKGAQVVDYLIKGAAGYVDALAPDNGP